MSQVLCIYYSQSGNMKRIIEMINNVVGGDLLEVEAKNPYTGNNKEVIEQWKPEFFGNKLRDAKDYDVDLSKYDTVVIGAPNWGGTLPPPLKSFILRYTFEGKRIIPVITHGGGGLSTCADHVYELTNASHKIKPLVVKKDNVTLDIINEWITEIDL